MAKTKQPATYWTVTYTPTGEVLGKVVADTYEEALGAAIRYVAHSGRVPAPLRVEPEVAFPSDAN